MPKLPTFIKKLLWDVKIEDIPNPKNSQFIIERVLEYGDEKAFSWLCQNYSRKEILPVLKKSRRISPKTGNFYALYYKIPKEKLLCIRKPFTQKQNRF